MSIDSRHHRENDDASVEQTGLKQSLSFVQSMDRTVEAAQAQVDSGHAKLEYANSNLERVRKMFQTKITTR